MTGKSIHDVAWIAAAILAILALVGVDFPALQLAVLAGAVAEVLGE